MEWSWKKLFPTVFPVPVALNPNAQGIPRWDPQEDEIVDEPAFAYGYYVPFKESVAQFLSIDSVYNAVMENFAKNSSPLPGEPCAGEGLVLGVATDAASRQNNNSMMPTRLLQVKYKTELRK